MLQWILILQQFGNIASNIEKKHFETVSKIAFFNKEIHGIYIEHGVDVTLQEVQEMVKLADKDGTGMLTEKEFVESGAQEVSPSSIILLYSPVSNYQL